MNAIKFIQDNGVDKAREVVEGAPTGKSFISGKEITADFYDINSEKYGMADGVYKFIWDKDWCIHSYSFPEFVLNTFFIPDLKRLVESVDVINELGSLKSAKANLREMYSDSSCDWVHENARLYDYKHMKVGRVKQAIADYESIYGGEHV